MRGIHRGLVLLWLTLCAVASAGAADTFNTAYITELLAENKGGLADEGGEHHGWIEIHNGGQATVNLVGWFLTDTRSNLTKWAFPNVALLLIAFMCVRAGLLGVRMGGIRWRGHLYETKLLAAAQRVRL